MNIMLVSGGSSCEHDISIITSILARRHFVGNIYCCYFARDNFCYLVDEKLSPTQYNQTKKHKRIEFLLGSGSFVITKSRKKVHVDYAVNCCHGGIGEGGGIAGLLQLTGIPFVGSNYLYSGVPMDKQLTKLVLNASGIDTVKGVLLTADDIVKGNLTAVEELGYPLIIKPCTLGSSIGINVVEDKQRLENALEQCLAYDNRLLVEQALTDFTEYNCSAMVIDGVVTASKVDKTCGSGQMLSFADKYLSRNKNTITQAEIDERLQQKIKEITIEVYKIMALSGVVRIDFLCDADGKLYVNEVNTIPGNLAYHLWADALTAKQFGQQLLKQADDSFKYQLSRTTNYNSTVLNGVRGYKR